MICERQARSKEMEKNLRVVKKMTGSMGLDENMGKVNWRFVRTMPNFEYEFMLKDKYLFMLFSKTILHRLLKDVGCNNLKYRL